MLLSEDFPYTEPRDEEANLTTSAPSLFSTSGATGTQFTDVGSIIIANLTSTLATITFLTNKIRNNKSLIRGNQSLYRTHNNLFNNLIDFNTDSYRFVSKLNNSEFMCRGDCNGESHKYKFQNSTMKVNVRRKLKFTPVQRFPPPETGQKTGQENMYKKNRKRVENAFDIPDLIRDPYSSQKYVPREGIISSGEVLHVPREFLSGANGSLSTGTEPLFLLDRPAVKSILIALYSTVFVTGLLGE